MLNSLSRIAIFCKYTFLLFCFFVSANLFAQNFESQISKVLDEKGLSPSATFAIVEDPLGFIWFGTVDGLYRYDGYNFKIYRKQISDTNSLSNNTIRDLCMGDNNKLWIATQGGGISCLDLVTEKFTNYFHYGNRPNEISGNTIWSLLKDRQGHIWAGISGFGVDCLNPKTGKVTSYNHIIRDPNISYETNIRSICEDNERNIWIGTDAQGIKLLNPEKGFKAHYFHVDSVFSSLSSNSVYSIYIDKSGTIWASTYGGGINKFNSQNQSFTHYRYQPQNQNSLISDLTYSIVEDEPGEYWVSSEYGVTMMNDVQQTYLNYFHDKCNINSLSDNRAREVFIDSKGIMWIGTESGVDRLIEQNRFMLYKNSATNPNSLPEGIVRSIFEDNEGNLWIGLIGNGLVRYDKKAGRFHFFKHDPTNKNSLPGNHITAIFQDSRNDMWFGEWDHGLVRLNKKTGGFEWVAHAFSGPKGLSDNRIQVIREAKPGVLWLGTEGGINRFEIDSKLFTFFMHEPDNLNSLNANAIQSNAFVFDKKGNIWVGNGGYGFNKIEFVDSKQTQAHFKSWKNIPDQINSLSNNNVISMHLSNDTILWIGTFGGGLNRFDIRSEKFTHYSLDHGLPNNIIFGIFEDKTGNLWLSTDKGISKFNPKTQTFQNFDQSDGLQNEHFFWGSSHISKNGEIFFGGIEGLNSFFPDSVNKDIHVPSAILTDLKLFNQSIKVEKSISWLKQIDFRYNQNFLTFEFSGLDYFAPKKNQYKYKLEGIDQQWVNGGSRRFANYTDLSPGSYTFRLNVSNNEDVWSAEELTFKVTIHPPWWNTWIARGITLLFIIGIVWFLYTLRINILKQQKNKLELEVISRTIEITEKNVTLEHQTEEILYQKEALNKHRDELFDKNNELMQTLSKLEIAQKALIESEKMASLGILSAGVAHEINNPLNFISVSIFTIKGQLAEWHNEIINCVDAKKIEELESLISYAEIGIERITNIVNSLRAYSHNKQDEKTLSSINHLIDNALIIIKSKIDLEIQLNLHLQEIPEIWCKQDKISQVFINIIDNALFAIAEIPKGGLKALTIQTGEVEIHRTKYVQVSFTNSGPPIKDEIIKHLFDPFYTTKAPNMGTGLGLYLSYNIIKEHEGLLKVENSAKGVVFTVNLPI